MGKGKDENIRNVLYLSVQLSGHGPIWCHPNKCLTKQELRIQHLNDDCLFERPLFISTKKVIP